MAAAVGGIAVDCCQAGGTQVLVERTDFRIGNHVERPWHGIQSSVRNIQAHWLDCLATGAEPHPSGADNLRTLDLAFKAYESAESGRAVPVEADRLAA